MKKIILRFVFFVFISPVFISCSHSQGYDFRYDLSKPGKTYKLPGKLKEVSGITFYRKNKLACVQDEKGKIYIYDLKKEEVKQAVDFGDDHDYEGIANVNDTIYVLSSHGNIYEVHGFETDSQTTIEHETFLTKENNTEGLCYDKEHNRLLIACKGSAGHSAKLFDKKAIYSFDLTTDALHKKPAFTIDVDSVKKYLEKFSPSKAETENMKGKLNPEKDDEAFQPSEIAIHPITHDIYVLASVGKLLIVVDQENNIRYIANLDPDIFKQPEGITFNNDGDLFISDEGRSGKGNILEFNYKK